MQPLLRCPVLIADRYRLLGEIGRGGASTVFRAVHEHTGDDLAVKVLRGDLDEAARTRFEREARAASIVRSAHVVRVLDAGFSPELGGAPYLAMELLRGPDLEALSARAVEARQVVELLRQLARALDQAHAAGIVHRDLKPANLLWHTPEDGPPILKVLDFGISKVVGGDIDAPRSPLASTSAGCVLGTPMYMAPEQVTGAPVGPAADLFAVGLIAVKLLTGEPYWASPSLPEIVTALCQSALPAPSLRWSWLPAGFDAWFARSCAHDPSDRFTTAAEQVAAFAALFGLDTGNVAAGAASPAEPSSAVVWKAPPKAHGSRGAHGSEPTDLPLDRSPLVGRARDLAAARALVLDEGVGLVTLTGAGGSGKTRLAATLAATLVPHFPDGVYFVALAPLRRATFVASAIAQALSVPLGKERSHERAIAAHLQGKRALLVLDNFEHVLGATPLVGRLLRACPDVRMLVTSRAALGLSGERQMEVPPLALPAPSERPTARSVAAAPAVELFVRRARAVRPDFAVTDANASCIAEICARLDGLPLALELAASRTKLLTPEALLARLDRKLDLLTGGGADLPARQRTMRATLAWGYNLLDDTERAVLSRLATFPAGATLDATLAVCDDMDGAKVFETASSLLDKSLLRRTDRGGRDPRYGMLETIRDYVLEQLEAAGAADAARARQARYVRTLAEEADEGLRGPEQATWLARLNEEHDNARTALDTALAQGDVETALALAASLTWFWYVRGHYREGRTWLERALALPEGTDALRGRATCAAGTLAFLQCDYDRAIALLEEACTLLERSGDVRRLASALQALGSIARERAEYDRADVLHARSLALFEASGDARERARTQNYMAFAAWLRGDLTRAGLASSGALEALRAAGDAEGITWSLLNLAAIAHYGGDAQGARDLAGESLATAREAGYREGIAWSLNLVGLVAHRAGDVVHAKVALGESLRLHHELGDRWRMASVLEALGGMAITAGRARDGVVLVGAASALRDASRMPVPPCERPALEAALAEARRGLSTSDFASAWSHGRGASLDAIVATQSSPVPGGANRALSTTRFPATAVNRLAERE